MQRLAYGQYCGSVGLQRGSPELLVSTVRYNRQTFNGLRHHHENAHIGLVLSGGCLEKKQSAYELLPGSVCFYHAGEPHQMLKVADHSLDIHVDIRPEFFDQFPATGAQVEMMAKNSLEVKLVMVGIWRELLADDPASMLTVQMELMRLFSDPPKAYRSNGLSCEMGLIAEFLAVHWNEEITLNSLARISGLHPVTVSKYFSRYFGCTLGAHLRKLKIAHALKLLPSAMPLTEVAYRCGFFDQSHFTRTFKQLTGFLPLQFRNHTIG